MPAYGIDALAFDGNATPPAIVSAEIVDDILHISDKLRAVRCVVVEPASGGFQGYADALKYYVDHGFRVFVTFPPDAFRTLNNLNPQAALQLNRNQPNFFTNAFIREFAVRAAEAATALNAVGVQDFIIWNEPNVAATQLSPRNFAALMFTCWFSMTNAPHIYWGGVFTLNSEPPAVLDAGYVDLVHDALVSNGMVPLPAGGAPADWPWTGMNLHIHRERSSANMDAVTAILDRARTTWQDQSEVIVGEWGVTNEEEKASPGALANQFDQFERATIKNRFSVVLFHAHHVVDTGGELWGLIQFNFTGVPVVSGAGYQAFGLDGNLPLHEKFANKIRAL